MITEEEALVKVRGYLTDYLPLDDADEIDEIMKALEQENSRKKKYKKEARRWKRRYLDLRRRIFKLEEQTKLIPVSERLPKGGQEILLFDKNFGYVVGTYGMVNYFGVAEPGFLIHKSIDSPEMASIDPIAWMPLPTSYQCK